MTDISHLLIPAAPSKPFWSKEEKNVNYDEIDAQLATDIEGRINEWCAGRKIVRSGDWFKIGNNGGLAVNATDGHWADHSEDAKGKGLLSLYAFVNNVDLKKAANDFSTNVIDFASQVKKSEPPIPQKHYELGAPDHVYEYRDVNGRIKGAVMRWNATSEKSKEIRQLSVVDGKWTWKQMSGKRPLYRGETLRLKPTARVLVVEGEKCVEAAEKVMSDWIVVSWAGGGKRVKDADWDSLENRDVVIWPDNDKAGWNAANEIKSILPHAQVVNAKVLESDVDIAELIEVGADRQYLDNLIPVAVDVGLFVDLESIFEGDMEPERPTIAMSASGECLLYAGRINEIHGEPSVGKTNINIAIMACELAVGRKVMFVDPEDNPHGIMRRCLSFGLSKELILANLYYLHDPTPEDLITAAAWAERNQPSLVTVDGLAEVITSCGYKEDAANDVLEFFSKYIRPFTRSGAAVVLSDHVTKSTEGRGTWSRGSGAKMGRYDGVSYMVTLAKPYSPTCAGSVKFTIAKDRNGGIGTKGQDVFVAYFEPSDGVTQTSIQRLKKEDTLPMDQIKELVEIVAMHRKEGVSPNQGTITGAKERHKMSAKRAKDVLDLCVENGYIAQAPEKLPGEKSYRFIIGPEVIKG